MKKLFENVEGNRFKLLTESVNGEEHVISGLKKVFGSGLNEISYDRVEAVGLGYIKDVSTAQRVSLQEAKRIAESFGYKDDEQNEKFVKEEEDISHPKNALGVDPEEPYDSRNHENEEKREVEIGTIIYKVAEKLLGETHDVNKGHIKYIMEMARELIDMHNKA